MDPLKINIEEWERFGGGGNGWSYYSKTDDSVVLKLNNVDIPFESTLQEFNTSRALFELGLSCPRVLDFVTDGARFGMTIECLKDKKSYVRMIADNPQMLEPLAMEFAMRSREFHSKECDTSIFESKTERCRRAFERCDVFSQGIKDMLSSCLDSLDKVSYPVHGDFTPGNIVRSQGRDYWIDLGEFAYGDPDMDLSYLIFLAEYTPAKIVNSLFHISRKQFSSFLEIYGRQYYGRRWHSPELEEKIHKLMLLKAAQTIAKRPRAAILYLPFLKGQKFRFAIKLKLADIFLRTFN